MKKYLLVSLFTFQSILISQPLQEFRAVKLTNVDSNILFTDLNIAQGMDYLASVNVNAVLCVVWNGGYTLYPSNTMDSLFEKPIHPSFTGRDALERVIIEAHRNGIEVYPWFEYGFAAWYSGDNPPSGGHILQAKPDWACRLSNGQITKKNGFDWMSAIHPEVQDFMNKLIIEVMQYDIDGIEFSDRIPAMPIEGGYEPYTVSLYQLEHSGENPPTNFYDVNWKRWRANKMNQWYGNVRNLIKNFMKIFLFQQVQVFIPGVMIIIYKMFRLGWTQAFVTNLFLSFIDTIFPNISMNLIRQFFSQELLTCTNFLVEF
jgi:uncharacterized lipoprotein YddW (UPF0748 family)